MAALAVLFVMFSFPGFLGRRDTLAGESERLVDPGQSPIPGELEVRSQDSDQRVSAEVSGRLPFPFAAVSEALADPSSWCEFLALHFNTKACAHGSVDGSPVLVLYSGRKYYEKPGDAHRMDYRFTAERDSRGALRVTLRAGEGPFGTRDHRIEVQAASDLGGSTIVSVRTSYVRSTRSRVATALYLATLGRGKKGFSQVVDPDTGRREPVQGVRGIIERNAVRYYLALQAFLQTRKVPQDSRFEERLRTWFDLAARYPQLEELDREAYLEVKRRERRNQLELQQKIEAAGPTALPNPPGETHPGTADSGAPIRLLRP